MPKINFRLGGFAMGVPVTTASDINGKTVDVSHLSSEELMNRIRADDDDETRLGIGTPDLGDFFQTSINSCLVLKDLSAYISIEDLKPLEDRLGEELEILGED